MKIGRYDTLFTICDTVLWHKNLCPPQDENDTTRNTDRFIELTWNKSLLIGLVVRAADKIDKERKIIWSKNPRKTKKKVIKKIKDALDSFPESNEKTINEQGNNKGTPLKSLDILRGCSRL